MSVQVTLKWMAHSGVPDSETHHERSASFGQVPAIGERIFIHRRWWVEDQDPDTLCGRYMTVTDVQWYTDLDDGWIEMRAWVYLDGAEDDVKLEYGL